MYIGKVELTNEWQKVEDLIKAQVEGQSSFAFAEGNTYQLQAEASYGAQLCDAAAAPADGNDGEYLLHSQVGIYQLASGSYLYAKVHTMQPGVPCWLKISKIGA